MNLAGLQSAGYRVVQHTDGRVLCSIRHHRSEFVLGQLRDDVARAIPGAKELAHGETEGRDSTLVTFVRVLPPAGVRDGGDRPRPLWGDLGGETSA